MMSNQPTDGSNKPAHPPEMKLSPFEEQIARLSLHFQRTRGMFNNALHTSTSILTDADDAERLRERHQSRVRREELARLLIDAYVTAGKEKDAALEALARFTQEVNDGGIFLLDYSKEKVEHRLTAALSDGSPAYVIVEASGAQPDPDMPYYNEVRPVADVHIHLPEAQRGAQPVFEVPGPHDSVRRRDLLETMLVQSHAVAQIDDIVCAKEAEKLRLVSSALDRGIRHTLDDVNAQRGREKIEYFTAEIVTVRGIRLDSGEELLLDHEIPSRVIENGRSFYVCRKFHHPKITTFTPAWILEHRFIPVEGVGMVKDLIVDWTVLVAQTKN